MTKMSNNAATGLTATREISRDWQEIAKNADETASQLENLRDVLQNLSETLNNSIEQIRDQVMSNLGTVLKESFEGVFTEIGDFLRGLNPFDNEEGNPLNELLGNLFKETFDGLSEAAKEWNTTFNNIIKEGLASGNFEFSRLFDQMFDSFKSILLNQVNNLMQQMLKGIINQLLNALPSSGLLGSIFSGVGAGASGMSNVTNSPIGASSFHSGIDQHVTINTDVSVNVSDGQQGKTIASQTAQQVSQAVRGVVLEEIGKARRPGGILYG